MSLPATLSIGDLLEGYRSRRFSVTAVMEHVLDRIAQAPERRVWISVLPAERVLSYARSLELRSPESLPLYGVPFAIKDNIDLEGVVTTAACPDYAYMPNVSAHVVQRLIDAGAIPIGKTNLDQFATGLVGTRSPYGACRNSVNAEYVSGGSSSGSAVAVATGLVSFSLGTDTAGSGRVPAAFNNIVGLKPTCGRLSTSGVVPACRSIDCVSIFALTADDAARVCAVAEGFDRADSYSRKPEGQANAPSLASGPFRFGIPRADQLEFFDDPEYARLFFESVKRLEQLGGECVEIDFAPFRAAARLLYDGAWIAERYDAVGEFIERKPESVHPVTRQLILASGALTAADAFRSIHRLADARRAASEAWSDIDVLVTPTAGTIYKIADLEWDPIRLNSHLGFYTNFVNFLDLAGVAVPAGFREDGLPFGITVLGQAWTDEALLRLADRFHRVSVDHAGALAAALPAKAELPVSLAGGRAFGGALTAADALSSGAPGSGALSGDGSSGGASHGGASHGGAAGASPATRRTASGSAATEGAIEVAVCGAHMEGLPLNHQLVSRGATFVRRTRTVPSYRFYALPGGPPFRPGLVRVPASGASVDVEVWSVPSEHFGSFVAGIPAPLGIGKVDLEDGQQVCGFLCEAHAVEGARDITALGGWRQYLRAK
jgi:allophanate hydrolase